MIKERISKLLTVKSIVTVLLTVLFIIVSLRGVVPEEVTTLYTVIVSFYFGTQHEQKIGKNENEGKVEG